MTSWLENQKCILTKENTRQRCFRLRKNNDDPIQSIQSIDESNPCPTLVRLTSPVTYNLKILCLTSSLTPTVTRCPSSSTFTAVQRFNSLSFSRL